MENIDVYSVQTFISYWNAASCTKDVALRFCITIQAAANKASLLRGQGYSLKYFRPTHRNQSVEVRAAVKIGADLLELAADIGQGSVEEGIKIALRSYSPETGKPVRP
jgi:hypothetical protein